ncbi:MAG: MobA/MobL family protein [Geobacteraceae bacterium]|nr:MobA/MobL family protein [Geobacteraceae bacterium]
MASYHCTVKVGGKGKAGPHAEYIAREGKYGDNKRQEDLEATGAVNMPNWAEHAPAYFWKAADEFERVNGATYREIEIALPRELTLDQRRELVEDFVKKEIGEKHACQWAIHTPLAALEGKKQPHAHIMYSERTRDGINRDPEQYFKRYNAKAPERGGCRKDSAGTEERLQSTRKLWADLQNAHLERHGHDARVDHRTLDAQGLDRNPEMHLGAIGVSKLTNQDRKVLLEHRAAEIERIRAADHVEVREYLYGAVDGVRRNKVLEQVKLEKAAVRKLEEMEKMQEHERSHKNKDRGFSR